MRDGLVILAQVVLSLLVAGAVVPLLLFEFPAMQPATVGPYVVCGVIGLCFIVLRLAWPPRRP
jgi:hypothetical protein